MQRVVHVLHRPADPGRVEEPTPASVLDQVRRLAGGGHAEVVLTGVHIGDYGLDLPERRRMLPELIEDILDVEGLERFRLSSIEPASIGDEIVTLMAESPKFARHFHIPFQSGSDAVLARMRRRYRAGDFADLVTRIGERIPDCGIGTDVICGFPARPTRTFSVPSNMWRDSPSRTSTRSPTPRAPVPRRSTTPGRCRGCPEAPHAGAEAARGGKAPRVRTASRGAGRRCPRRAGASWRHRTHRRLDRQLPQGRPGRGRGGCARGARGDHGACGQRADRGPGFGPPSRGRRSAGRCPAARRNRRVMRKKTHRIPVRSRTTDIRWV